MNNMYLNALNVDIPTEHYSDSSRGSFWSHDDSTKPEGTP